MSSSLRINDHEFYNAPGITASENSDKHDVIGARGFSIMCSLTDNGSGAGSVDIEASNDNVNWVSVASATISFSTGSQLVLFNVVDPMYQFTRVATTVSAGDIDITANITVIEGSW